MDYRNIFTIIFLIFIIILCYGFVDYKNIDKKYNNCDTIYVINDKEEKDNYYYIK